MHKNKTKDLIETSLLIALVYLFTSIGFILPITVNSGGYIHFGDAMAVITVIVFGTKKGVIANSFGMALFDFTSGYTIWLPFTFIIRGTSSYIMGKIAFSKNNGNSNKINFFAVLIANIINLIGYYFAQVIIYGNFGTALLSVPSQIIEILIAICIGLPMAISIKKVIPRNF